MIGSINTTCFSFHPRKSITTGEGGMIVTNDENVEKIAKILRSHGASTSDLDRHNSKEISFEKYDNLGYNYRMTDIQASIGVEQFKKLDYILKKRRELAHRYNDLLKNLDSVVIPFVPEGYTHTYQSYMLKLNNPNIKREKLMQKLLEGGVSTRRGIMTIHREPYYIKNFGHVNLPITEKVSDLTIIIPLFVEMTEEQQDYIVKNIKEILTN